MVFRSHSPSSARPSTSYTIELPAMNRMILANLVHRPFRTIISVVAVAVEVTLILLIVGIMLGMLNDSKTRQAGIGADIMVQPPGSSLLMGVSGAPVSVKVADKLRKLPHVVAVAPVVTQLTTAGNVEVLDGIDLPSFDAVSGGFHYLSGGPFQEPYDMIIDDLEAGSKHRKVGDMVETLNHPFRICGIVEHGKGARKFVPIATLQDLIGALGKASIFYVKLDDPNTPTKLSVPLRAFGDAAVWCALVEGISQPDDVGQHSRPHHRDQCCDWHCHDHRLHRHLPGHVRRGDGAHARDRHPEIAGRRQALYRERGAAGNAADRHRRGHPRDRHQLRRASGLAGKVPDTARAYYLRLAGEGLDYCAYRLAAGSVLSR